MIKKLMIVIILVAIATMTVTGCITNTTNNVASSPTSTQPASSAGSTHDPLLERYVTAQKDYASKNGTINAWEVSWSNDTTLHLQAAVKSQNSTYYMNRNVMSFPSNDAAAAYLNNFNKTGYVLAYTTWQPGLGPAEQVFGHAPSVYKEYEKNTFTTGDWIAQADNLIVITHLTI